MSGLSLWLCPAGKDQTALQSLIQDLARDTPGCIPFDPHLTLISDDQVPDIGHSNVLSKVSTAVAGWRTTHRTAPLEVIFQDVRRGSHFYQCVLIAAQKAEPLASLNATLRKTLGVPANASEYFPHVSLVYGDLTDEQRQDCVDGLKSSGRVKMLAGAVEVAGVRRYAPEQILLVDTGGPSSQWKVLGRVAVTDGRMS